MFAIVGWYSDGSGKPIVPFVTNDMSIAQATLAMMNMAEPMLQLAITEVGGAHMVNVEVRE